MTQPDKGVVENTAYQEPPFKIGQTICRRNPRKLRGQYLVVAEVGPDPNPGSDGYNIIVTHLGPYKVWPKDITEWLLVH